METTRGVTPAGTGLDGITWNILGQTYRPVAWSPDCFAFDTLFPPGTFVPPHVHPTQGEYIRVLEGRFELVLDGAPAAAGPGDLVCLPAGLPHGIFNRGSEPVRALFWVTPAAGLFELFTRIDGVADPAEVVRIAWEYAVDFLPPPG